MFSVSTSPSIVLHLLVRNLLQQYLIPGTSIEKLFKVPRWCFRQILGYDYDSNVINATAIKSQKQENLIEGYDQLYKDLTNAGVQSLLHKLDNEVSKTMIQSIKDKNLKYQLAPVGDHRTNPAQ